MKHGLAVIALAVMFASAGVADTLTLFGQGCGGDLVNVNGGPPGILLQGASANCVVGNTTSGASSETGEAGGGLLGVFVQVSHNGPGTAFQSSMQASFTQDIMFVSNSSGTIGVSLNLMISGLLTADPGTGYGVDLTSVLFGHLAGYNSSCSCGIGFPPLDGVPHLVTSGVVTVPLNTLIPFDLTLTGDVGAGGWPDAITLDLLHTVTLNPTGVFNLPSGVTIDSASLNISNNQWTDPRTESNVVPEPGTWGLLSLGMAGLFVIRRRRM